MHGVMIIHHSLPGYLSQSSMEAHARDKSHGPLKLAGEPSRKAA